MATKPTRTSLGTRTTKRVGSFSQGAAPWTTKKRSKTTRHSYPANWKELREKVLKRDNYTCCTCHRTKPQLLEMGRHLEVDHIIRLADGGTNAMINLQTLCNKCHENRLNHMHMRIRK